MRVQRYNYAFQFGPDPDVLLGQLRDMILSGRYELTAELKEFEARFAAYLGVPFVRGVNTGTDALVIALRALNVGRGDAVITQANTFHATVAAIINVGARPILVDADESTFLIDQDLLASAAECRPRVIMPVHLFGKPTPMDRILRIASDRGCLIIEDAAQAPGARIHDRMVGAFGDAACFSFHPSKNLAAAGDGGAIATRHEVCDEAVRRQRELGQVGQNNHVVLGLHSKLHAIQARILLAKLPSLDQWNARRAVVAQWYRERLQDFPVSFQAVSEAETHVFHLFQLRTEPRDALLAFLRDNGVDAVVRYPVPIHLQPAFAPMGWRAGQFPVAERLASELLCLPIRPDMTLDEVEFVCQVVGLFFGRGA